MAGGKPPIRVCQRRSPSGHARLGAAGCRRSPCRRCDWMEPLVECPAGRKNGGNGVATAPSRPDPRAGATRFSSPKPRFCAGPASEMKGGARGNGRGRRTSSLSLSRFLCAWVTSLATACDSSFRTDSSRTMASAWAMSMGRALNEGRDIFHASLLPHSALESMDFQLPRGVSLLPGRWRGDAIGLRDRSYRPESLAHPRIESRRSYARVHPGRVRGSALSAMER